MKVLNIYNGEAVEDFQLLMIVCTKQHTIAVAVPSLFKKQLVHLHCNTDRNSSHQLIAERGYQDRMQKQAEYWNFRVLRSYLCKRELRRTSWYHLSEKYRSNFHFYCIPIENCVDFNPGSSARLIRPSTVVDFDPKSACRICEIWGTSCQERSFQRLQLKY